MSILNKELVLETKRNLTSTELLKYICSAIGVECIFDFEVKYNIACCHIQMRSARELFDSITGFFNYWKWEALYEASEVKLIRFYYSGIREIGSEGAVV